MTRDLRVKELTIGTMKSAKSAQLIMKGHLLDLQGKRVLTFKPEIDTRDGDVVSSRALPMKREAIVVPKSNNGNLISEKVWTHKPDVVLIDELQFFTEEQVEKIAGLTLTYDVDVYAYGLLISYTGEMFSSIKKAIECAFTLNTIDMSCDTCSNSATHHLLYIDGKLQTKGDSINVEDNSKHSQKYQSVCYSCYIRALDIDNMDQQIIKER